MEKEYVILNLEKEYPGYTGTEKWMIITDLTEAQFLERYPEEAERWKAAVVLNIAMGDEIMRFHRNESKHEMRKCRTEISLEDASSLKSHVSVRKDTCSVLMFNALSSLPPVQQQRVIKHCGYGSPVSDIAEEEECSTSTVYKSVRKGLKKLSETDGLEDYYRNRRLIK